MCTSEREETMICLHAKKLNLETITKKKLFVWFVYRLGSYYLKRSFSWYATPIFKCTERVSQFCVSTFTQIGLTQDSKTVNTLYVFFGFSEIAVFTVEARKKKKKGKEGGDMCVCMYFCVYVFLSVCMYVYV